MGSKIIKSSVEIKIKTDSGYESNDGMANSNGIEAIEYGLRSLVRLLYLHNEGDLQLRMIVQDEVTSVRRAVGQQFGKKRGA